jgi:hypothetical protein
MDAYAANLGKVMQGDSSVRPVYRDAHAFFEATYLTTELHRILSDVLSILTGKSGDRVLQLRTPFGGGKTHTLLSLYHLARSRHLLSDLPDLSNLPDPGTVRLAVISGVDIGAADTHTSRRRTLWGELAWQLGGPEGYGMVAEQDRLGVAPGGDVLARLIGDSPTLLLLDEVLLYVENAMGVVVGESTLGRQTITFLQRLTEIVAAAPRAAMVYSLQASEQEAGGNLELLGILGKLVQRLNAIREPVSGDEVLRVVQRRLFARLGDDSHHQQVASAYAEVYRGYLLAGSTSAQVAQQQAEQLRTRILLSYPFHPALLDLMRERWGSLPSYQRTRGALQFLATTIHTLWAGNVQTQPLIGPGDIPLVDGQVRATFLAQVGEQTQYDAVLQADLIGPHAGARTVDALLVQESPHLQAYLPGTRIATAALLYSFGGRSQQEYGVYEHELLSVCLAPGLDRNILQTALHDLNERLLYLHRRELRYRFETQPNLNKMIIDENQRRGSEEIEERLRLECSKAIGNERGAIIWPNDTQDVRDRLAEFQIVYLSPSWLDVHSDRERQEQGMQLYIEQWGNSPRRHRNGLTLAVPERRMVEAARNAVRLILTLELVQSQSTQRQLTPQQEAELVERKRNAENELKGAISQLYPVVYTPQNSEKIGQTYTFDALTVQSYSQAPQLHTRIKEALRNRVVWDSVQPSKIATQVQLNESQSVERQYYEVTALVSCFFSYYNFAHIWDEKVVRQAIMVGIKNRTFAYVANARKDEQGNLILGGPAASSVHFGKDIPAHEIDMGEGAYLLSAVYATQLLTPPAPPKIEPGAETPTPGGSAQPGQPSPPAYPLPGEGGKKVNEPPATTIPTPPPARPVAPGQSGQHYRLRLNCKPDDLFEVMKALDKLNERSMSMNITVFAVASAKPDQPFIANTLHNLVVEPMLEESDVVIQEEQVEE